MSMVNLPTQRQLISVHEQAYLYLSLPFSSLFSQFIVFCTILYLFLTCILAVNIFT